jgi:hypothetical protein
LVVETAEEALGSSVKVTMVAERAGEGSSRTLGEQREGSSRALGEQRVVRSWRLLAGMRMPPL